MRSDEALAATLGQSPADPARALVTKEAVRRLQSALNEMDEPHRAVFILFELEGESCEAIAAGLGVPVGTVHSRLHSARKAFRERVARGEPGEEKALGRRSPEREIHVMAVKEPT